MEQRKAALQGKHKKAAIQRWTPWSGFRNLRSQTAKVVALSVSVATFAFIYNYFEVPFVMFKCLSYPIIKKNRKFHKFHEYCACCVPLLLKSIPIFQIL
jgi:hypothetical protein